MQEQENEQDGNFGSNALFIAAQNNNKDVFQYLMAKRGSVNSDNVDGITPLMISIKEGHFDITKLLLDSETNGICQEDIVKELMGEKDGDRKNVFHYALESNEAEKALEVILPLYGKDKMKLKKLFKAKDLHDETPLHKLVQQHKVNFDGILTLLNDNGVDIISCMKIGNDTKKTPLHIAAQNGLRSFVTSFLQIGSDLGKKDKENEKKGISHEKDEDSNTPLHLAVQHTQIDTIKLILDDLGKYSKDKVKFIRMKNNLGWSPFSEAVANGNPISIKEMLKDLSNAEKKTLMEQLHKGNYYPLHLAARFGHVEVFKLLLKNCADITRRGPDQKTALHIAIEREQRSIITIIINGPKWKETFRMTSLSYKKVKYPPLQKWIIGIHDCLVSPWKETSKSFYEVADTPLKKLIRHIPDLAEEFLDKCNMIENVKVKGEVVMVDQKIDMKFEFIDDHRTKNIDNHPLMIMANEQKIDLLQHPLCLAFICGKWYWFRIFYGLQLLCYCVFLACVNIYILSSPSPINSPQLISCTAFFGNITLPQNMTYLPTINEVNSDVNDISGILILMFSLIYLLLMGSSFVFKTKNIDATVLLDAVVFLLSFYSALFNHSYIHRDIGMDFRTDVRSCSQWHLSAITITFAWINLLLYMRLVPIIGNYIIVFQQALVTCLKFITISFIFLVAFGLGFSVLLSNKDKFDTPAHSLFKTMTMMAGEFDFGDIFFEDKPPEGWGDKWDRGPKEIPFPFYTYTIFIFFFLFASIVGLNVLIGLTVNGIPKFMENADLQRLTLLVRTVLEYDLEQSNNYYLKLDKMVINHVIWVVNIIFTKFNFQFDAKMTDGSDFISKEKKLEKTAMKQEDKRRRAEVKTDMNDLKEFIHEKTRKKKGEEDDEGQRMGREGLGRDSDQEEKTKHRRWGSGGEGDRHKIQYTSSEQNYGPNTNDESSDTMHEKPLLDNKSQKNKEFDEHLEYFKRFFQDSSSNQEIIFNLRNDLENQKRKVKELNSVIEQLKSENGHDKNSRTIFI